MEDWTPSEEEIRIMEDRIRGYIFPNLLNSQEQQDAFDQAVLYQLCYEHALKLEQQGILPGTRMVRIGHFQFELEEGAVFMPGSRNIPLCREAYSCLLWAGLLYRGLPR